LAAVGAVLAGSVAYAFAATLSLSSSNLSAGNASVSSCNTDGTRMKFSYASTWNTTAGHFIVNSVTVKNIPVTCQGLDAQVVFQHLNLPSTWIDEGTGPPVVTLTLPTPAALPAEIASQTYPLNGTASTSTAAPLASAIAIDPANVDRINVSLG
jgi:hypothetical protein